MRIIGRTIIAIVLSVFCASIHAQTVSDVRKYESVKVKATVLDAESAEKNDITLEQFAEM